LQLLDDGYEVSFKRGFSRVLDSRGDFICNIVPLGRVFRIDFSGSSSSTSHCLVTGQSSELWKWHRRLGQLSFDLLVRLNSLDLIRG